MACPGQHWAPLQVRLPCPVYSLTHSPSGLRRAPWCKNARARASKQKHKRRFGECEVAAWNLCFFRTTEGASARELSRDLFQLPSSGCCSPETSPTEPGQWVIFWSAAELA